MKDGRVQTDHVEPSMDRTLEECFRQYQSYTVQSQNGDRHIPFMTRMRSTPSVAVGVGSAGSITTSGFELNHSAAAACTVIADARL